LSHLAHPAVRRVQAALIERGSAARIIELETTARSAEDAAAALGTELGAIVKSLVFTIDGEPVMVLVSGDRRCDIKALPQAFGRTGLVMRPDADRGREATGFSIGGVAPLGHPTALATAIDDSLGRFDSVYAAAGHPHCVFETSLLELSLLTGGAVVKGVSTAAG
jgi:prolyl-tRNA editing enzyme YbaK/EbsC (Cys-tRNA(Pro) deacylase)